MAIPFYESVLKQRLPMNGSSKLRDIDTTKAWLGDTAIYNNNNNVKIYKASNFIGNKTAMSWLPDSLCAVRYQEYLMTGTIHDQTTPSPPFNVRIKKLKNKGIKITWEADADIESGIKYFKSVSCALFYF